MRSILKRKFTKKNKEKLKYIQFLLFEILFYNTLYRVFTLFKSSKAAFKRSLKVTSPFRNHPLGS